MIPDGLLPRAEPRLKTRLIGLHLDMVLHSPKGRWPQEDRLAGLNDPLDSPLVETGLLWE